MTDRMGMHTLVFAAAIVLTLAYLSPWPFLLATAFTVVVEVTHAAK